MLTKIKSKKLTCFILAFVMMFSLNIQAYATKKTAVVKPSKVMAVNVSRSSSKSLVISWEKASEASGYEVYMKTGDGTYKKIATTKKLKLTQKELKIGSTYYFKVRGYKKTSKGKVYGTYSDIVKKKLSKYDYFVNVIEPYHYLWYTAFTGAEAVKMAGNYYYNSFKLSDGNSGSYAYFNLNGKYKKFEFLLGEIDGENYYWGDSHKITIYADDELIKTIELNNYSLPKKYSVNVKDVYKFEIHYDNYGGTVGFGEAKLYY